MATIFFDTNVIIYAHLEAPAQKSLRAAAWLMTASRSRMATISVQVLNELFWTLTRKFGGDVALDEARLIARRLSVLASAPLNVAVHLAAQDIHAATNYRWRDCLVLASAQAAGCTHFLSEDLQHDHVVGNVRVIDPFQVEPGDVLAG